MCVAEFRRKHSTLHARATAGGFVGVVVVILESEWIAEGFSWKLRQHY